MSKALIKELIAKAKLEKAIKEFSNLANNQGDDDLRTMALSFSAQFHGVQRDQRMGIITWSDYQRRLNQITHGLLETLDDWDETDDITTPSASTSQDITPGKAQPVVFISYRTTDQKQVKEIKRHLEEAGIKVLIDYEQIKAGQELKGGIVKMIREADLILSVLSVNSLDSPWVGMEADITLNYETVIGETIFLACTLDKEILADNSIVTNKMVSLKEKIDQLEKEKERRKSISSTIDCRDLDADINRYEEFMINLPKIMHRYKNYKTVDISPGNFSEGIQEIIETVKNA